SEILIWAAHLLGSCIENDEVVDDLEEAITRTELQQCPVERFFDFRRLLPSKPVLLRSIDHGVPQAFDVVAGYDQLDRGEERPDEVGSLVSDRLPNPLGDSNLRPLELNGCERDAIDKQDDVRALCVIAGD